jgi:hypothetical protein
VTKVTATRNFFAIGQETANERPASQPAFSAAGNQQDAPTPFPEIANG